MEIDAVRIESIIAPYRENGEGIKMMDAIEKLLFTSDEAKRWIYHPLNADSITTYFTSVQTPPECQRQPAAFYDSGRSTHEYEFVASGTCTAMATFTMDNRNTR
ncbi:hypothetical protein LNP17_01100 [Klebsiella variicola subsp. variicola]|nr:hypothetical protein [Klebsiella variicola subsp. variicola]